VRRRELPPQRVVALRYYSFRDGKGQVILYQQRRESAVRGKFERVFIVGESKKHKNSGLASFILLKMVKWRVRRVF
jgi:hypothetical protein